jgi:hypothetical protein
MIETPPETQENKPSQATQWSSILQFVFSSLGILLAGSISGTMLIAGILQLFTGNPMEAAVILTYAATGFFVGVLLLPSTILSFSQITGREIKLGKRWQTIRRILHPKWLILILPVIILIGHWANQQEAISWLILPPIHPLAVSIPIVWLVWLGIRQLKPFSFQRSWGIFTSGLILGPAAIFTIEIIVFIFILLFGVFSIVLNPESILELEQLTRSIENLSPGSMEELELLTQIINSPTAIFFAMSFFSVIVPLIEEALKPVGVWLLAGRNLSPEEGFMAGIISGAGYALFENLGNIGLGPSWSTLVLARVGTSIMHIFTAGLIGYTLALAWKENRYLRLGTAYLLAVIIHGLWNGLAILSAIAGLNLEQAILPAYLMPTSTIAMIAMTTGLFILLILTNRKVRSDDPGAQIELPITDNIELKE